MNVPIHRDWATARLWLALLWLNVGQMPAQVEVLEPLVIRSPLADLSSTASGESGGARSSPDGRFLLFLSSANDLVTHRHNGPVTDLFVREMATGTISLVSVTPDGMAGGDDATYQGAISADGRYVAFESSARNLVSGASGSDVHLFIRDRESGVTQRIPPSLVIPPFGSVPAPLESPLAMDGAGRRIAWVRGGHVYVFDRETGVTTALTQPISGGGSATPALSWDPQFSSDGLTLAFGSSVANLVRPGTGPTRAVQVYVVRFDRGNLDPPHLTQIRLTNAQLPMVAGGYSGAGHSLDAAGRFLTVAIPPAQLPATAALGVFRFDLESGSVEHLSRGLLLNRGAVLRMVAADHHPAVAFQVIQGGAPSPMLTNGLFVWTPESGLKRVSPGNPGSAGTLVGMPLEFSRNGRRLLFTSANTHVIEGLAEGRTRYAFHDLETGRNSLAVGDDAEPRNAILLGEEGAVVFESSLRTLADSDLNRACDLFIKPPEGPGVALLTPRIPSLVSRTADGISSLGDHAFSADGRYLVLTSTAGNLVSGDNNGAPDVFLQDRRDGSIRPLSVPWDGTGVGTGPSGQPELSEDGRYVAFISGAPHLVSGDAGDRPDLFRRDLVTGVTSRVSVEDGPAARVSVQTFAMSGDGQRLVWLQREPSTLRVLYRDMAEPSALRLIDGPGCAAPAISRDGSVAAFIRQGNAHLYLIPRARLSPALTGGNGSVALLLNDNGTRAIVFRLTGGPSVYARGPEDTWTALEYPEAPVAFRRANHGILSPDGRWLAFAGIPAEPPFSLSNGGLGFRVFLMDLVSGQTMGMPGPAFGDIPDGDSDRPSFSPDGRHLVFRSAAGNWVSDDDNRVPDLFILDRSTGVLRLVSRSPATGIPWERRSYRGRFGAGRGEIWMQAFAERPLSGDLNGAPDTILGKLAVDDDQDGLEDQLEKDLFGGSGETGSGDRDRDGMSNADELAAGTDPLRSDSVLTASVSEAAAEVWTVSWPSVPGRRYRVLSTDGFDSGGVANWESEGGVITATGTLLKVRITTNSGESGRYLRLSVAD